MLPPPAPPTLAYRGRRPDLQPASTEAGTNIRAKAARRIWRIRGLGRGARGMMELQEASYCRGPSRLGDTRHKRPVSRP